MLKIIIIYCLPPTDGVEIYRVLHGRRDVKGLYENYFEGLPE